MIKNFTQLLPLFVAGVAGLAPAWAQPSATAEGMPSPENLPLRGLTQSGNASLRVYPQLDKGLLITPGAHPVTVPQPLTQVLSEGGRVTAKIESNNNPRGKFQGLLISVQNNSDRPLIFDGDAALGSSVPGSNIKCISLDQLAELSVLPEQSKSFGKRFTTDLKATASATVTMGWAQTLRDQKQGSEPVVAANGGRYGLDEQRRQDQFRRFGKRVLWPGDSTSGVIYFNFDQTKTPLNAIVLPVSSYYDRADQATLTLSI
ncbi:MAG: hypothetical protein JSS83_20035 [Cyanobacteria bacterium SZAS LIN-3]|nr:hypothetical protein [Cyanobacteria bacterium SZAS LIN-3]MBS2005553.1 hypothetical protein [Cyanobacteria bacterium SZAS TMP-1]